MVSEWNRVNQLAKKTEAEGIRLHQEARDIRDARNERLAAATDPEVIR
jgi:hypothetical protein